MLVEIAGMPPNEVAGGCRESKLGAAACGCRVCREKGNVRVATSYVDAQVICIIAYRTT